MSALSNRLKEEFCPPLDESLILSLIYEIEHDDQHNPIQPTNESIELLRTSLLQLSSSAEAAQLSEHYSDMQFSPADSTAYSTESFFPGDTTAAYSSDSSTSSFSSTSLQTPLGFLQTILPHISTSILNKALIEYREEGVSDADLDMWDIVTHILTIQAIREMEERGLEEDSDLDDDSAWQPVERKNTKKVQRPKPIAKFALKDVRQRHHLHPKRVDGRHIDTTPELALDPWAQLVSISTHISSFLPSYPATYFQSYFHRPEFATPYLALRAAFENITIQTRRNPDDLNAETMINLLDLLLFNYNNSEILVSDTELSLKAANGRADDALELVKILRDLDASREFGVHHRQPLPPSTSNILGQIRAPQSPSIYSNLSIPSPSSPSPWKTKSSTNTGQWQKVQHRKNGLVINGMADYGKHKPTYTRDVNGMVVGDLGDPGGTSGRGKSDELREIQRRVGESMRRRDEMLKEASKMWKKGRGRHGGAIAMYFSERAREFQDMARKDSLDAARIQVQSHSHGPDIIDLHGTTVFEGVQIMKETMDARSSNKPLRIITGRGTHSVNQVGVLKPAVKRALIDDGWNVGEWDAGLIVRGRR